MGLRPPLPVKNGPILSCFMVDPSGLLSKEEKWGVFVGRSPTNTPQALRFKGKYILIDFIANLVR